MNSVRCVLDLKTPPGVYADRPSLVRNSAWAHQEGYDLVARKLPLASNFQSAGLEAVALSEATDITADRAQKLAVTVGMEVIIDEGKITVPYPINTPGDPEFYRLVATDPHQMICLESSVTPEALANLGLTPWQIKGWIGTARLIDLWAPFGHGQRGLIVSPPKVGKTTILRVIGFGVAQMGIPVIYILVFERPEEVTRILKTANYPGVEIYASTFDEAAIKAVNVAELALERAKRLVEAGKSVLVLVDSITKLGRAYNGLVADRPREQQGSITKGGIFRGTALYPGTIDLLKRFFGAGRATDRSPGLGMVGSMLLTKDPFDSDIWQEMKGTGNWDIYLAEVLAGAGIYPAVNLNQSSTREDHLLLGERHPLVAAFRRSNRGITTGDLLQLISQTASNQELLETWGNQGGKGKRRSGSNQPKPEHPNSVPVEDGDVDAAIRKLGWNQRKPNGRGG